jgi:ATP-dependent Clp protease ATP-binding subunit ClpA
VFGLTLPINGCRRLRPVDAIDSPAPRGRDGVLDTTDCFPKQASNAAYQIEHRVLFAAAVRWRYRGRSFGFAIDGVRIVLLQVLDDGRLTDGQGRTVDFRNTLIVLTSNLGSEALASLPDGADVSVARSAVMAAVRDAFRPEFLNRLDEILLFRRLSRDDMKGIVAIQLERLKQLLADRKITLEVDAAASTWLAHAGYDPVYGARPLKRVIQRELQKPLAQQILEGRIPDGSTVHVGAGDGGLVIGEVVMTQAA